MTIEARTRFCGIPVWKAKLKPGDEIVTLSDQNQDTTSYATWAINGDEIQVTKTSVTHNYVSDETGKLKARKTEYHAIDKFIKNDEINQDTKYHKRRFPGLRTRVVWKPSSR